MSNDHCSSPSLIPRPVAVNSVPRKESLDAGSNTQNPETSTEHLRKDIGPKTEDGVVNGYEKLALSLRDCDWEQLQKKFTDAMDERSQAEMVLQRETAELLEMFIAWSQTTAYRDEDRAYKRFKTRMGFAQNSEAKLEEKKKHYANVVRAFEDALALLRVD
ncbi:hypothetical protein RJZ56_004906 [Blastomyces dermatitidis]|uniref:Uncharacterized protein n=3 Tax=Blastomyces TaxID=229219 RepID=A0A179U8Y2_BLAGS|nr:uncharacterized protein BDBG_00993 [Blastomyces gilchristii SLH14081]XP_045275920.1 uncharacterized protein BDCG_04002 [Blastomyces dermatitidis ER-3]EGE81707.1 hypothetical protein BDDG_04650 [Blastomyces dermatitidis ATCC 18188]EQL31412.1 hypothetical protein BDFG_06236 [Blastomyces dermatitidis ATCC 26199]EEQ88882.2 hypothetical protein BDCG_04002 [Blastomyces dermatitidis ER-3]OAT04444.1 hypothetical protein BDBG_00993 [Blastomyces gilchristii SLH14081]